VQRPPIPGECFCDGECAFNGDCCIDIDYYCDPLSNFYVDIQQVFVPPPPLYTQNNLYAPPQYVPLSKSIKQHQNSITQ
jgi:hypothetical protein